jgi:hypothetical protein
MNYQDITNEIYCLVDQSIEWSDGDKFLDISSAEMGESSVNPVNATKQPIVYPKVKAALIHHFDLDSNGRITWPKLKGMITKAGCSSGLRLVLHYTDQRITHQWKAC